MVKTSTIVWIVVIIIIIIIIIIVVIVIFVAQSPDAKKQVGEVCALNADCDAGLICDLGVCKVVSGGICTVDTQCTSTQECIGGSCQNKGSVGGACTVDGNCMGNFVCDNNLCKIDTGEDCTASTQCKTGTACLSGTCQPIVI